MAVLKNQADVTRCSSKQVLIKNSKTFRGKHLCWSFFLIKLQVFNFPVSIAKSLRVDFHKTTPVAASEKIQKFFKENISGGGVIDWFFNKYDWIRHYVSILLTLVDISRFHITWQIFEQFKANGFPFYQSITLFPFLYQSFGTAFFQKRLLVVASAKTCLKVTPKNFLK